MDKGDVEPMWLRTTERVMFRGYGRVGTGWRGWVLVGVGGGGQRAELMTGFICHLSPGRLLLRA